VHRSSGSETRDRGDRFHRNVGTHLPQYTASWPGRQEHKFSARWKL